MIHRCLDCAGTGLAPHNPNLYIPRGVGPAPCPTCRPEARAEWKHKSWAIQTGCTPGELCRECGCRFPGVLGQGMACGCR